MRCIYNFYWIVWLICSSSTFGQESNFYFPGSSRQDRYLPNYRPQTQQNALYQQQFPSSFSNPLYTDDLHNQDLRLGNQFPLNPSYNRASTNSQPSQFRLPQSTVDTFASYITKPNRPQPVQPSPFGHQKTSPAGTSILRYTQRPPQQYSHVHSHDSSRNNNHEQFLGQITLQSPNTDYTDSTTYQFPPHSSLVDHFSSQKTQSQPWKNQKPSFRLPVQNNNFEELSESDLLLEDQSVKQRPQNRKKPNQPFQKNILGNPQNRFVPLNQESNNYKSNLNTFIKPSKPVNNFFQTSSIEIPKNHRDHPVKLDYNNKNINNFDYDSEMQPLIEDEEASENNYDNENIKIVPPNVDSEESTFSSNGDHQNDDYDTVDAGDNTDTPASPIFSETTLENESSTITELQETTATSLSESVALENDHTSTNTLNNDDEHTTDSPEISTDAKNEDTTITISKNDEPILLGEAVVSVVTTKSVVNGTISIPQPTQPTINLTTEQMKNMENQNDTATTESWVVVSSIQTSRSASGARFLPPEIAANIDDSIDNQHISSTTPASKNEVNLTEPNEIKSSTESIIDKLDRVQSELSSGLLISDFKNDNITVITDHAQDDNTTVTPSTSTTNVLTTSSSPVFIRKFSPYLRPTTTQRPKKSNIFENIKMDDLTGLLPAGFKPRYTNNRRKTTAKSTESPNTYKEKQTNSQSQEQSHNRNTSSGRSFNKNVQNKIVVQDDISAFLPPGYKQNFSANPDNTKKLKNDNKLTSTTTENSILSKAKPVDISAFLPPGYKLEDTSEESKEKTTSTEKSLLLNAKPVDISAFLPPGYKLKTTTENPILAKAKPVDINAFLPPGYSASTPSPTTKKSLLANAKPVDIKAFLPPGYKIPSSTENSLSSNSSLVDISKFLPADYKFPPKDDSEMKSPGSSTSAPIAPSTTPASSFKVVFPSRPGGRKPITRLTTPRTLSAEAPQSVLPAIRKGPPTRATTEFTGWPTPSTTPISIEKLLEAARTATESASPNLPSSEPTISTTTTTTTTTTTPRPTTPGVCKHECDLAATIKLVGGAKWVPELLNHNTKEWQLLANEVQTQLESAYIKSEILNRWFKKIRIDGFSEGSVLVDYIIELNDVSRQVDTRELKQLFHNALNPVLPQQTSSDPSLEKNETSKNETSAEIEMADKLKLGNFIVDPNYTDFIVIPKQIAPTVGYADENVFLPQWAIAVIVIGLASLLFVIIFGVTVLVNRQKNAKKRQPAPLTEDMLNELNKNHMSGIDNYGADDLYNMEDVWNDRGYDIKLPKKRSVVSLQENHAPNLYDSWRSEWNGYYYNAYYGNPSGSASATYGRRRSDYDTNF